MRSYIIVPLGIIACLIAGLVAISRVGISTPDLKGLGLPDSLFATSLSEHRSVYDEGRGHGMELMLDVEAYEDRDYGFSMAIPAGWRRIVTADVGQSSSMQTSAVAGVQNGESPAQGNDPVWVNGYAVGFESAQQNGDDRFADYILVEILPGELSGLFAADASRRQPVLIDGRDAWYDRLEIQQASSGLTEVDLVIYQAELSGVGYTVGLYAIGEHTSERVMAVAFEVMLQTFRINSPPFPVS